MLAIKLALAFAAAAVGVSGAVVVLYTSGPLARTQSEAAGDNPATVTATATSTPQPEPVEPSPVDDSARSLTASRPVDVALLAAADTTGWETHIGPTTSLSIEAPKGWVVSADSVRDLKGEAIGDVFRILKPDHQEHKLADHLVTSSGWVEIIVSAQPFQVPIEADDESQPTVQDTTVGVRSRDRLTQIRVLQLGPSVKIKDNGGALYLMATDTTQAGRSLTLTTLGTVHFDADPRDVAIVIAILSSARLLR